MPSRPLPRHALLGACSLLLLGAGIAACKRETSSHGTDHAAHAEHAASAKQPPSMSCETDKRVHAFKANLDKKGERGTFALRLAKADPAPPAKGSNSWNLQVLDASGAPVPAAKLALHKEGDASDPSMPDHGHGSSKTPVIDAKGDGSFSVEQIDLFMPGVWRAGFDVSTPDGKSDTVYFFFCIQG